MIPPTNTPAQAVNDGTCEVPITELLRAVPRKHRLELKIETGLGGYHLIPVGVHCHDAADKIDSLRQELSSSQALCGALKEENEKLKADLAGLNEDFDDCEREVSKVYLHITNGKFSKMNTMAEYIIQEHDDALERAESELRTLKAQNEGLREALSVARRYMTLSGCGNDELWDLVDKAMGIDVEALKAAAPAKELSLEDKEWIDKAWKSYSTGKPSIEELKPSPASQERKEGDA